MILGLLLQQLLLLRRVQASSPAKTLNAGITCIKFSFHRVFLLLPFCFLVICGRYFVCTYSYMG